MVDSPSSGTANTLSIDYAGNPDLKEMFSGKEVGDKCKITLELQVMSSTPDGMKLAIAKVISEDGYEGKDGEDQEAVPSKDEPIMMTMRKRSSKGNGYPHNRPPQTATNSADPYRTSYV